MIFNIPCSSNPNSVVNRVSSESSIIEQGLIHVEHYGTGHDPSHLVDYKIPKYN